MSNIESIPEGSYYYVFYEKFSMIRKSKAYTTLKRGWTKDNVMFYTLDYDEACRVRRKMIEKYEKEGL